MSRIFDWLWWAERSIGLTRWLQRKATARRPITARDRDNHARLAKRGLSKGGRS